MSTPKQPGVSVELRITRDSGVETKRYSTRPFGGAAFTEERVRKGGWGVIRRELSDDAGQVRMSSASVLLNDDDEAISAAIDEDPTRFVNETEAKLGVLSEAGRAAGLPERALFRARVDDTASEIVRNGLQRGRAVRLNLVGALAPFLDRNILQARFLRSDFPDIHRDLENTFIPVVIGEHSDAGAEDVNGNSAEKGIVPAIYAGGLLSVNGEAEDGTGTSGSPSFLTPPVISSAVNGTPGTTNRSYGVTKLSALGETVLSNIEIVTTGPTTLNGTDNITLSWTDDPDATGYVVYRGRFDTPTRRLKVLAAGSDEYTDDGTDSEYAPGPPEINTARVESEIDGFFWDLYVVGLGYMPIDAIYASDVAAGGEPKRITDPAFVTAGTDFCTPTSPNWPLPNPWYTTASGLRLTVFLGRGPRSQHHKEGIVTIAVKTCGAEDVGDATGDPFEEAFPILQHVLNEYVFKDGGQGYRSGTYGPLEEFADGTPILQTSRFQACQDLTKTWLGNAVGYKAHVYLREPMTVRQFLQTFFLTIGAFGAENHHGQFYPVLYDSAASITEGRLFRERIEIIRVDPYTRDKEHVEPRVLYQFDWDPDAGAFRSEVIEAKDDLALADQQRSLKDPSVLGLRFTRDAETAEDVMERRRDRLKYPRWMQTIYAKYQPGLEVEPGDQIRIDHSDGPGEGWIEHPFKAVSLAVDLNAGEVAITGYDVLPLLLQAAS